MAKSNFSEINVKAAAITGAIVGFLCWLLVIPFSFSGYGMMGYVTGTLGTGIYPVTDVFHNYSVFSIVVDITISAILFAAVALIYNWALKLK